MRTTEGTLPTDYTFTGQKVDASAGLMYYGARYYDVGLGRFISADTIVPSAANPQALNRYAYVLNNPLKYTDPTGHCVASDDERGGCARDQKGHIILREREETRDKRVFDRREGLCHGDYCKINAGVNVGWIIKGVVVIYPATEPIAGPISEILTKAGVAIGGDYIWDDDGNKYGGVWIGVGRSPLPLNWNLIEGVILNDEVIDWLLDQWANGGNAPPPRVRALDVGNFIRGLSGNATVGAVGSWGLTGSSSGLAVEVGKFTSPQAGVSAGFGFDLPWWLQWLPPK